MPEQWRKWPLFDNIFRLSGVPVITVQLRYNGWVTEMQDPQHMQNLSQVRVGCTSLVVALGWLLRAGHQL